MKLKTRLAVAFMIITIVPMILIFVSFLPSMIIRHVPLQRVWTDRTGGSFKRKFDTGV